VNQLYFWDSELSDATHRLIGVDEAGRGALAGPVVVAAVILDYSTPLDGINDSKKISPRKREQLSEQLKLTAVRYQVSEIDADYIDKHNILQATLLGMFNAVSAFAEENDLCLIDGNQIPRNLPCHARCVIGGDALSACIAAASILAKVHRDRIMIALDEIYPQYGFAKHKGYGTAQHFRAISDHGPSPLHRMTFAPLNSLT
jgi:ribonuclease HII